MKRFNSKWLVIMLTCFVFGAKANNIQINNVNLTGDPDGLGYAFIEFDLSWDNSWRMNTAPNNWDAAWVFAKYRVDGGVWQHVWLNNNGHSKGSGTKAVIETGLLDDKQPFNSTENPGIGAIIYRSGVGVGTFNATGMQLRWNYLANGVPVGSGVEVKVFAIEMVLVPGGPFWVGDGYSGDHFREANSNAPYQVTAEGAILKCTPSGGRHDFILEDIGIWLDGDGGISRSSNSEIDMNSDFPTGFRGFYCMKYEISQGQYRDFLNSLTRQQQNQRTETDLSQKTISNRYVMFNSEVLLYRNGLRCDSVLAEDEPVEIYCDYNGNGVKNEFNDGEWIACSNLSWADGIAYMDWSGLRPITELEYEKSCRGPLEPVPAEYPWGTTSIVFGQYLLSNEGSQNESILTGYILDGGNASYNPTTLQIGGPLRVGIFAGNTENNGRITAGAGYYGAMELGGNLFERVVTVGKIVGRNFNGIHGDGKLSITGESDAESWPSPNAEGSGNRGGSWRFIGAFLQTSDRYSTSNGEPYRFLEFGFRGGRSVAPFGGGY